MAGGKAKRPGGLPLSDRPQIRPGERATSPGPATIVAGAEGSPRDESGAVAQPPVPEALSREPAEPPPRFCWVSDGRGGRHPGVLLEWRKSDATWLGRVAYGVGSISGVRLVEQWVAAPHLSPP